MNFKEMDKKNSEYLKITYKCKCSHSVIIPNFRNKNICKWCGSYVFKDEKAEFKFRIEQSLKKV